MKQTRKEDEDNPETEPKSIAFLGWDEYERRIVYIRRDGRTGRYQVKPIRRNSRALREFLAALERECSE